MGGGFADCDAELATGDEVGATWVDFRVPAQKLGDRELVIEPGNDIPASISNTDGIVLSTCHWVSPSWNFASLVYNSQYASLFGGVDSCVCLASMSMFSRIASLAMALAVPREASPKMQKDRMQTIVR